MLDTVVQIPSIETEDEDILGVVAQKTFFATGAADSDFYLPADFPFRPVPDQPFQCLVHACMFQLQHDIPNMFSGIDMYAPRISGFSQAHFLDIPFHLRVNLWKEEGFFVKGKIHEIYCGREALTWEEGVWKVREATGDLPVVGDLILMYYLHNH